MATVDPRIAQEDAELLAARNKDLEQEALTKFSIEPRPAIRPSSAGGNFEQPSMLENVGKWVQALPRNIGVGLMDAAVNTADAMGSAMHSDKPAEGGDNSLVDALAESNPYTSLVKPAVLNFRNELAKGSGTSDEVTQAIAQYAVPFMGYAKLVGGLKGASALGTAGRVAGADAATAATVLAPHDPRFADLMQLGKHVEGKFGTAMNTIAPDGSLLNAYIDYMTNRDNESEAEGRFKNVVDNLGLTAATSALVKTAATVLKGGREAIHSLPEAASKTRMAPANQVGEVGVRVNPSTRPNYVQIAVNGKPLVELPAGTERDLVEHLNAVHSNTPVKAALTSGENRTHQITRTNNASGESSASLEAISRSSQEKANGQHRAVINEDGTVIPLIGVDSVDATAKPGQVIVQRGVGADEWTVLDRGGVPSSQLKGRINAAMSQLNKVGEK